MDIQEIDHAMINWVSLTQLFNSIEGPRSVLAIHKFYKILIGQLNEFYIFIYKLDKDLVHFGYHQGDLIPEETQLKAIDFDPKSDEGKDLIRKLYEASQMRLRNLESLKEELIRRGLQDKIVVHISSVFGIYTIDKKQSYPIKGKRYKLIMVLREGLLTGKQLSERQGQSIGLIGREIREINEQCKTKLGLELKLIEGTHGKGYILNTVSYSLRFEG